MPCVGRADPWAILVRRSDCPQARRMTRGGSCPAWEWGTWRAGPTRHTLAAASLRTDLSPRRWGTGHRGTTGGAVWRCARAAPGTIGRDHRVPGLQQRRRISLERLRGKKIGPVHRAGGCALRPVRRARFASARTIQYVRRGSYLGPRFIRGSGGERTSSIQAAADGLVRATRSGAAWLDAVHGSYAGDWCARRGPRTCAAWARSESDVRDTRVESPNKRCTRPGRPALRVNESRWLAAGPYGSAN
jgi:hypothetical protein